MHPTLDSLWSALPAIDTHAVFVALGLAAGGLVFLIEQRRRGVADPRIPALLDSAGIPGLSIAVVEGGETVWTGAFGVRNAVDRRPVDPETVFEAASLSKPVFAYGLLRLVDRDGFDLDRPLSEYVDMAQFGDDPRMDAITARQILTHTSGISGFAEGGKVTMGSDPGARFRYFGDAWLPLQRAVEAATGEPVHEFLRREVLEPFGMTRSSFVWNDLAGDYATPHDEIGKPMEKRTFAEAHIAATLHTTATDYAHFLVAAMEGEGLSPESHRAWAEHAQHREAKRHGVESYYSEYSIAVGQTTYSSSFTR